jgi:hypothetical protein
VSPDIAERLLPVLIFGSIMQQRAARLILTATMLDDQRGDTHQLGHLWDGCALAGSGAVKVVGVLESRIGSAGEPL